MKKKDIIELGISQYELFRLHSLEAIASGEQEAIHQMRVALKKFYALKKYLLHGMDSQDEAVIRNYLEPLRLVYRSAGKVRDVQVLRSVTDDSDGLSAPEAFGHYLHSMERSRLEKFMAISKAAELPTQRDLAHFLSESVRNCYNGKSSQLEHLIGKNLNEARFYLMSTQPGDLWHEARTLIKQNYLLMQLAAEHQPHRFSPETIQQYRDMEQVLGRWHDHTVLKKYVLRFESTRISHMEAYIQKIDQLVGIMEQTIREVTPAFGN